MKNHVVWPHPIFTYLQIDLAPEMLKSMFSQRLNSTPFNYQNWNGEIRQDDDFWKIPIENINLVEWKILYIYNNCLYWDWSSL